MSWSPMSSTMWRAKRSILQDEHVQGINFKKKCGCVYLHIWWHICRIPYLGICKHYLGQCCSQFSVSSNNLRQWTEEMQRNHQDQNIQQHKWQHASRNRKLTSALIEAFIVCVVVLVLQSASMKVNHFHQLLLDII